MMTQVWAYLSELYNWILSSKAFDAFLAERKHTTQEPAPIPVSQNDNGPVYRSLNTK